METARRGEDGLLAAGGGSNFLEILEDVMEYFFLCVCNVM